MQDRNGFLANFGRGINYLLLALALAGISCSRSAPTISYSSLRLVIYQQEGGTYQRYSFFVLPHDEDGLEDLDELYLYHDREGLAWRLSSEDWLSFSIDGNTWVGSHSIAMNGEEPLPRGQFRAVIVDKGGERSERLIGFDAPQNPRFAFPLFTVAEGRYVLESGYPEHFLVCYNEQGAFLQTLQLNAREGSLESLSLPQEALTAALWAEDGEYQTAALTTVVPLR